MRIDSHQHFWIYDAVRDSWIDDTMSVIKKDFMPGDLAPILRKHNIDGCIAVQADQSEEETQFLLDCAGENDFIKGVVGWVDLCTDQVFDQLERYAQNSYFKGVRHILQAENNDFLLRKDFQNGISQLQNFDLTYDLLITPGQLKNTTALVKAFPNQPFVVDHLAKPKIKTGEIKSWEKEIRELAHYGNVSCKVSGMVIEADWQHWQVEDFTPYLDVIFEAFGTHRIMYGSDWPVCLLGGQYGQVLNVIEEYISYFSTERQENVMGGTASNFYNLA